MEFEVLGNYEGMKISSGYIEILLDRYECLFLQKKFEEDNTPGFLIKESQLKLGSSTLTISQDEYKELRDLVNPFK